MMAMVPLAMWTVLGTQTLKALLFPLAFLFFAVPFGEFLVPPLMDWTADFTALAIRARSTDLPRRQFPDIPTGTWSVVEACSGLRYLIASFMVGCLFAYLSYRSARPAHRVHRGLARRSDRRELAARLHDRHARAPDGQSSWPSGADHLVYGWIFFGLVMVLLFWIGANWREDDRRQLSDRPLATALDLSRIAAALWISLVSVARGDGRLAVAGTQHASASAPASSTRAGSHSRPRGWTAATEAVSNWRPDISGARANSRRRSAEVARRWDFTSAFYSGSSQESKAITSANQLVRTRTTCGDRLVPDAIATTTIEGQPFNVRTSVVTATANAWRSGSGSGSTAIDRQRVCCQDVRSARGAARPRRSGRVGGHLTLPDDRDEDEAARQTLQDFATRDA